MHYDLGFFDQECGRVTSAESPFDAKVYWPQPVIETLESRMYAGVFQFRISLGRVFSFFATESSCV
jgi:hypothetical protein